MKFQDNIDHHQDEEEEIGGFDQKDWKKVIDDIALSQKMVENLVQSSSKMGISTKNYETAPPAIQKPITIETKKTQETTIPSLPSPPLQKANKENDSSLAFVDMIAEEMSKEYQENFEKIKAKFKDSLKQKLGVKETEPTPKKTITTNEDFLIKEAPQHSSKESTNRKRTKSSSIQEKEKERVPPLKTSSSIRQQSLESSNRSSHHKYKSMESSNRDKIRLESLESTNRNRARMPSLESTGRSRRNKTQDLQQKPYEIEQTPIDNNKQLVEKEAMKLFEAFKSFLEEKLNPVENQKKTEIETEERLVKRKSIPSDHIVITDESHNVFF